MSKSDDTIMVRATAQGYYEGLRKEGDVFAIKAPHKGQAMVYAVDGKDGTGKKQTVDLDPFSANWMEKGKLDKDGNFVPTTKLEDEAGDEDAEAKKAAAKAAKAAK